MTMSCGRARRVLWPDASPQQATPEIVEARAHASGCCACRLFRAEMTATATLIHRAAPAPLAPAHVRERLFFVTAETRMGPPARGRWPRRGLTGAVALTVLALGLWQLRTGTAGNDPVAALAEDHGRATTGPGVRVSDPEAAANWLRERLPFAVQVPAFPGGKVKRARLFRMAGSQGGVVEYRLSDRDLSYYMVPSEENHTGGDRAVRLALQDGYRVVTWREGGMVHGLVADLPEPTLRALARICMAQMTAASRRAPAGSAHRARMVEYRS